MATMERIDDRRPASGVTLPRTPKQERSRRKQERLLDAAEELFAARGFEEVTADDIAERAGYGTGTFYNYFANKTQAFVLVADRHDRAVVPTLEPVIAAIGSDDSPGQASGDVGTAVRGAVRAILAHKARVPWLVRTWTRLVLTAPEVTEFQRRSNRAWEAEVAALLTRGIDNGRVRPVAVDDMAATIRTVVDAVTNEVVVHGQLDAEAAVQAVGTLLESIIVPDA